MRFFMILMGMIFTCASGYSDTWYVPDDSPTIQQAINAAKPRDTVVVRHGDYYENIDLLGKAITVRKEKAAGVARILGTSPGEPTVKCVSGEGPKTVLEGLQIYSSGWLEDVMHVENSSPTVIGCHFDGDMGNGMLNVNSNPTVVRSIIQNCAFGIQNIGSSPRITGCHFDLNGVGLGNLRGSNPDVSNSFFYGNVGPNDPAAIYNFCSSPTFANITVYGNGFASQPSGMVNINSMVTVTNSIFWKNTGADIVDYHSIVTVTYSDVQGGYPGTGNIDANPLFRNEKDLHLPVTSPCRDAGDNKAVAEETDYEGDPRVANGTVDMGADEFHTHLYYIPTHYSPNRFFLLPGEEVEVVFVDEPGSTPVFLAIGSGILDDPIQTSWGTWWNEWWLKFPIIGPINMGSIPSPDGVLVFTANLPPNMPTSLIPMQALIGDSLTNLSEMNIVAW